MAKKDETQFTPKGKQIPVPERKQVLGDFAKVMEPTKAKPKKRGR